MRRTRRRPRLETLEDRTLPASFVVTSLGDSGAGSGNSGDLRYCLNQANSLPGPDSVSFAVTGTVTLTLGELTVTDDLTLTGPGAGLLTLSGNHAGRVFDVTSDVALHVSLSGLTITGGSAAKGGGLVFNDPGSLTLSDCLLTANQATGGNGGALFTHGGTLALTDCTFSNNSAAGSGGGYDSPGVTATITGCTFSGNVSNALPDSTPFPGGGALSVGAGSVTIRNTTISGNQAAAHGGGINSNSSASFLVEDSTIAGNSASDGGGVRAAAGTSFSLGNSLLANNSAPTGPDASGTLTSLGHNLTGASLAGDLTGNVTGRDPLLGPLRDNGGPTMTMALQPGSPALDAGSAFSPADQRGVARPQGSADDIGAFEARPFSLQVVGGNGQSATVGTPFPGPLQVQLLEGPHPLEGAAITFTAPAAGPGANFANDGLPAPGPFTTSTNSSGLAFAFPVANTAAGSYVIIASASGVSAAFTLANSPAPASHLALSGPATSPAGSPFGVTVVALDPFGNVDTNYAGTVHFTSSDPLAALPPDYTFSAPDFGRHLFPVMLFSRDTQLVSAADSGNPEVQAGTLAVSVLNVAPVVRAGGDTFVNAGQDFVRAGSVVDPGINTWVASADYGDGTGVQPVAVNPDGSFTLRHVYAREGEFTVNVTARDDLGASGSTAFAVDVFVGGVTAEARVAVAPGETATAAVPGVTAVLSHAADAPTPATLVLAVVPAGVAGPASGQAPQNGVAVAAAYDIRILDGSDGDVAVVTFSYPADFQGGPTLFFRDPATGTVRAVSGSKRLPSSLLVDPARHTITIVLDDTSTPRVTALGGTLFTISAPQAIPLPVLPAPAPATSPAASTASSLQAGLLGALSVGVTPLTSEGAASTTAGVGGSEEERGRTRTADGGDADPLADLPRAPRSVLGTPALSLSPSEPRPPGAEGKAERLPAPKEEAPPDGDGPPGGARLFPGQDPLAAPDDPGASDQVFASLGPPDGVASEEEEECGADEVPACPAEDTAARLAVLLLGAGPLLAGRAPREQRRTAEYDLPETTVAALSL